MPITQKVPVIKLDVTQEFNRKVFFIKTIFFRLNQIEIIIKFDKERLEGFFWSIYLIHRYTNYTILLGKYPPLRKFHEGLVKYANT